MIEERPTVRADMTAGTLYAVAGEAGWVYYGQVTPEKSLGFFRRRDRVAADPDLIFPLPIMSVVCVAYPSITRALRAGSWKKLGRFPVADELINPIPTVQWPVGTLDVTVWIGGQPSYDTRVDDPAIQAMERMAVWDAEDHIPARLTADFGAEPSQWNVGGPIRRERLIAEEAAKRWSDKPEHRLPPGWVTAAVP